MSSLRAKKSSRIEDLHIVEGVSTPATPPHLPEVMIGRLVGRDDGGRALVDYPGNPNADPLPALATAAWTDDVIGRDVALLFAEGDPSRPIIIGVIQTAQDAPTDRHQETQNEEREIEARVDGERVVLSADQEIVLKCGKASITLTRAGKVLIRGSYLLSRSSGVNRIKGGSVQLN